MMARIQKGLLALFLIIFGGGVLVTWALLKVPGLAFNLPEGGEAVAGPEPGFSINHERAPNEQEPAPKATERPAAEQKAITTATANTQQPQKSRAQLWAESIKTNVEVWKREGADEAIMAGGMMGVGSGKCDTGIPLSVPIKLSMDGTTDSPGKLMGHISEDIQGQRSDGEYCVAIPFGSPVTLEIGSAGKYATDLAPVKAKSIWLDGEKITIDSDVTIASGIPGAQGKANHHTVSKVTAGVVSALFGFANNASRFGSVSVNSGSITNPVEDTLRKKLERPSEIRVADKPVVYITLEPVTTRGYP